MAWLSPSMHAPPVQFPSVEYISDLPPAVAAEAIIGHISQSISGGTSSILCAIFPPRREAWSSPHSFFRGYEPWFGFFGDTEHRLQLGKLTPAVRRTLGLHELDPATRNGRRVGLQRGSGDLP